LNVCCFGVRGFKTERDKGAGVGRGLNGRRRIGPGPKRARAPTNSRLGRTARSVSNTIPAERAARRLTASGELDKVSVPIARRMGCRRLSRLQRPSVPRATAKLWPESQGGESGRRRQHAPTARGLTGTDWLHEIKYDGYRMMPGSTAIRSTDPDGPRLVTSISANDRGARLPEGEVGLSRR
jgi:hypothetical protein